MKYHDASYRDRAGRVIEHKGKIYRICYELDKYKDVLSAPYVQELIKDGKLIGTSLLATPPKDLESLCTTKDCGVFHHEKLDLITYPYEWTFGMLKAAALFHLDTHIGLLNNGFDLRDATAYNVQFVRSKPVFIDFLSIEPYKEGEPWLGQRQFVEQFIAPLLWQKYSGTKFNDIFRGAFNGIPLPVIKSMLPTHTYFSLATLMNIILPCRVQNQLLGNDSSIKDNKSYALKKSSKISLLSYMRKWVSRIENPAHPSTWSSYADDNSYTPEDTETKLKLVEKIISPLTPETVWDVGCNAGRFSEQALKAGAKHVVGFDIDENALDLAFRRAEEKNLSFSPILIDFMNPSPNLGWLLKERDSIFNRTKPDFTMWLAVIHHLVIGSNVPMQECVRWIVSLSPRGVIEYVNKDDVQIKRMLRNKEDIYHEYSEVAFCATLKKMGCKFKKYNIQPTRTLYYFEH